MKKIIIICILIFIPFVVNAKELEQEWDLSYGSFASDSFGAMISDHNENNYIIGESYIDNDEIYGRIAYVLKIDKTGKILWKKDYFDEYKIGSSQYNDYILTNDGGILIAGQRTLYNSSGYMDENKYDAILLKYDKDGNKEWETIYGGTGGDYFKNITVTEDNEYIVIGNSDSKDIAGFENKGNNDVIALKFDTKGNIIWKKSWGGNGNDDFNKYYKLKDGSHVVFLESNSTDLGDNASSNIKGLVIEKYDKEQNLLWRKKIGSDKLNMIVNINKTKNDEFFVTMNCNASEINGVNLKGDMDVYIAKMDSNGKIIYNNSWGNDKEDYASDAYLTSDDELLIVGYTSSSIDTLNNKGKSDSFIVKYDQNGELIFQNSYGTEYTDMFRTVVELSDKNLLVLGNTYYPQNNENGIASSFNVIYNNEGEFISDKLYEGNGADQLIKMYKLKNNEYVMLGSVYSTISPEFATEGFSDALAIKYLYKYDLNIVETSNGTIKAIQKDDKGIITTEPNKGYEIDKIVVKNTGGNEIVATKQEDGTYSFPLNDDVNIEVLFKEILENPKTGMENYGLIAVIVMIISLICYYFIYSVCQKNNTYL